MANGQTSVDVKINDAQTTKAGFSGIASKACRVDGTIFLDTARSFIYPKYKSALEQAFSYGLSRSPAGSGNPVPAPNRFLLIVGHTDLVGSAASNQKLSER